jgi:hypothetical protein
MDSFNSMMGAIRTRACPDCGSEMEGGECTECGYGAEEGKDDMVEMQTMLDLRDGLQNCLKMVDRLIVSQSSED